MNISKLLKKGTNREQSDVKIYIMAILPAANLRTFKLEGRYTTDQIKTVKFAGNK
jgi:hypothetical protein